MLPQSLDLNHHWNNQQSSYRHLSTFFDEMCFSCVWAITAHTYWHPTCTFTSKLSQIKLQELKNAKTLYPTYHHKWELEVLQVVTTRISVTGNVMSLFLSTRQVELEVPSKCWQISTRMWHHIPDDSNTQSPISLTYVATFNWYTIL